MHNTKKFLVLLLCSSMAIFAGCSKDGDDDDNNNNPTPTPTPVTVNSVPQISGKIDGVDFKWVTGGLNPYQGMVGHGGNLGFPPDSCEFVMNSGFDNAVTGDFLMGIDLGTFRFVMPSDSVAMKNFFAIKSWAYSPDALNGVEISYFDSSGEMWSTSQGSGNQTGSTFLLQDRRFFTFQSENYIRIKASFNCKVYNAIGDVKLLTNCVVVTDYWTEY